MGCCTPTLEDRMKSVEKTTKTDPWNCCRSLNIREGAMTISIKNVLGHIKFENTIKEYTHEIERRCWVTMRSYPC